MSGILGVGEQTVQRRLGAFDLSGNLLYFLKKFARGSSKEYTFSIVTSRVLFWPGSLAFITKRRMVIGSRFTQLSTGCNCKTSNSDRDFFTRNEIFLSLIDSLHPVENGLRVFRRVECY